MPPSGLSSLRARFQPALGLCLFAVGSGIAVGAGAWAMRTAGEPVSLWARNGVAWIIGLAAAFLLINRRPSLTLRRGLLLSAVTALVGTLAFAGQLGVHRWIALGPVLLNAAAFVLPSVIVWLQREHSPLWRGCVATMVSAVLTLQPDLSQAVAFAAACLLTALLSPDRNLRSRVGLALVPAVGAILCLWRPDPLKPVPEVEGIVGLAANHSLLLAALMIVGLIISVLAPLLQRQSLPLVAYLATVAAFPALGAFPVPLAGYGISFVLGQLLAVGFNSQREIGS